MNDKKSIEKIDHENSWEDPKKKTYRKMIIFLGKQLFSFLYAFNACSSETTKPWTSSSLRFCTTALLYQLVNVSFVDATNAETEPVFLSWYESIPTIIISLSGILMLHNEPPSLQLICNAIFWMIDRFLASLPNVRALITC